MASRFIKFRIATIARLAAIIVIAAGANSTTRLLAAEGDPVNQSEPVPPAPAPAVAPDETISIDSEGRRVIQSSGFVPPFEVKAQPQSQALAEKAKKRALARARKIAAIRRARKLARLAKARQELARLAPTPEPAPYVRAACFPLICGGFALFGVGF